MICSELEKKLLISDFACNSLPYHISVELSSISYKYIFSTCEIELQWSDNKSFSAAVIIGKHGYSIYVVFWQTTESRSDLWVQCFPSNRLYFIEDACYELEGIICTNDLVD